MLAGKGASSALTLAVGWVAGRASGL